MDEKFNSFDSAKSVIEQKYIPEYLKLGVSIKTWKSDNAKKWVKFACVHSGDYREAK